MHKNLSRYAACLLALGFLGLCVAGEAVSQRVLVAPLVLAQVQHAKAVDASPATAATPAQAPPTAAVLSGEGDGDDHHSLATTLLGRGLGLLATAVYRAKAA
jgi:hypothetical protein